MTQLVVSITPERSSDLVTLAQRAWGVGADVVEIRADAFDGDFQAIHDFLSSGPHKKWIVTCRSAAEGGAFRGDTMERVSFLIAAARGTDAIVDFEFADYASSANIRQKVGLAAAGTQCGAPRLILSSHRFKGAVPDLDALIDDIRVHLSAADGESFPIAVAKVAYRAADAIDAFPALDAMHRHGARAVAIAMGDDVSWSRVLARKLGAFATYAALDADRTTAPGQLSARELIDVYRWRDINAATRVFGLLGDPVAHSVGPLVMNRWFGDAEINGLYVPIRVASAQVDALAVFLHECRKRPWLDMDGFSVTVPHKAAALEYAGSGADSMSRSIGAANTLVFRDGHVLAHNTDAYAALDSVAAALGVRRTELAGLTVDVLGSGGAARALVYSLREFGCDVTVFGRNFDKAAALAGEYGFRARPWDDRASSRGDLLVNATRVGMWPNVDESPMPPGALSRRRLVFDMVYNPLSTRLLADAAQSGVTVLNGLDMYVRQAAMQFALWTGVTPNTESATRLVEERLGGSRSDES